MFSKILTAGLLSIGLLAGMGTTSFAQSGMGSTSPSSNPGSSAPSNPGNASPSSNPANSSPTTNPGNSPTTNPGNSPTTLPGTSRPTTSTGALSATDRIFMIRAAQANLAEIQAGQLALRKSTNASVRQYAQRMITEHTQAQRDLAQIASARRVTLPTTVDAQHRALMTQMERLSGQQFDQAYLNSQVQDHARTATLLQQAVRQSQASDVRDYAARILPSVQTHLAEARNLVQSARR